MFTQRKKAFSFIELMIAIAIMGVLATVGLASYSNSLRSSRDSRRKLDLENIRNAVELFKSDSAVSSYPANLGLLESPQKYTTVPTDPQASTGSAYAYNVVASDLSEYVVGARLETPPSGATYPGSNCTPLSGGATLRCGTQNCNYCVSSTGPR